MFEHIFYEYWKFLNQFAPYLLLGFLIAGVLHAFVNDAFIQNNLLGNKFVNIVKATLIGIPLPLCSCGVIPVAMSLYKKGASKSATTSFLISTPQTGVDSIMMTYAMFLPILPIFIFFRPIAALIAGLLGGVLVKFFDNETQSEIKECTHENKSLKDVFTYGFITLPQDIAKPLLIGILFASIIALKPPGDLFNSYIPSGIFELLSILILSIPLYVCATASIPIAVALVLTETISPGGALVFLMAGPVTNVATITTIYKVLGQKLLLIYLFAVSFIALLFGYVINQPAYKIDPSILISVDENITMSHSHASPLEYISSILVLIILLNAVFKPFQNKIKGSTLDTKINVSGMTCNHCKQSVTDAILSIQNVNDVNVDLDSGDVFISGDDIDINEVCMSVEQIGFKIIK